MRAWYLRLWEECNYLSEPHYQSKRIRAEREQEFKESMLGYRLKKDRAVNFLDYFQAYINSYTKKDIRMVQIALSRFKDFLKEKYPMNVVGTSRTRCKPCPYFP